MTLRLKLLNEMFRFRIDLTIPIVLFLIQYYADVLFGNCSVQAGLGSVPGQQLAENTDGLTILLYMHSQLILIFLKLKQAGWCWNAMAHPVYAFAQPTWVRLMLVDQEEPVHTVRAPGVEQLLGNSPMHSMTQYPHMYTCQRC